jgi:hypothetical protein
LAIAVLARLSAIWKIVPEIGEICVRVETALIFMTLSLAVTKMIRDVTTERRSTRRAWFARPRLIPAKADR